MWGRVSSKKPKRSSRIYCVRTSTYDIKVRVSRDALRVSVVIYAQLSYSLTDLLIYFLYTDGRCLPISLPMKVIPEPSTPDKIHRNLTHGD